MLCPGLIFNFWQRVFDRIDICPVIRPNCTFPDPLLKHLLFLYRKRLTNFGWGHNFILIIRMYTKDHFAFIRFAGNNCHEVRVLGILFNI